MSEEVPRPPGEAEGDINITYNAEWSVPKWHVPKRAAYYRS